MTLIVKQLILTGILFFFFFIIQLLVKMHHEKKSWNASSTNCLEHYGGLLRLNDTGRWAWTGILYTDNGCGGSYDNYCYAEYGQSLRCGGFTHRMSWRVKYYTYKVCWYGNNYNSNNNNSQSYRAQN